MSSHDLTIAVAAERIGWLLRAMFGPAPVPQRAPEEDRWLDDGGAQVPGEDGWEHVIEAVR